MKTLVIAHLYPNEMNIYGDLGNVITLRKRMEWRGFKVEVKGVEVGERFDFTEADIVFGGGGQDSGQLVVGPDLLERGNDIRQLAEDGAPVLAICGLYQLFGRGFTTLDGQEIAGISVFRASTIGSTTRMIGNINIRSKFGELVGFENHSGQTVLEAGQEPLGKVTKGYGNNSNSGAEGAVSKNAIGTYMHGPLLPKNPDLADYLIKTALERRYGPTELEPLDDRLSSTAAKIARTRPQ